MNHIIITLFVIFAMYSLMLLPVAFLYMIYVLFSISKRGAKTFFSGSLPALRITVPFSSTTIRPQPTD